MTTITEGKALDRMTNAAGALIAHPRALLDDAERAALWDMLRCGQSAMHREDFVGAFMWSGGVLQILGQSAERANA